MGFCLACEVYVGQSNDWQLLNKNMVFFPINIYCTHFSNIYYFSNFINVRLVCSFLFLPYI